MSKTKIEWASHVWNPIVGCSVVSPGCTNCYAMRQAHRLKHMLPEPNHYFDTTRVVNGNPVWTGKVAQAPDSILLAPLKWRKPARIFVNSMGDLFHESVPDAWIDRVFAVMALAPQHTFQLLSKRSARMRIYCSDPRVTHRVAQAIDALRGQDDGPEEVRPIASYPSYFASSRGVIYSEKRGKRHAMSPDVGEEGHSRVQLHREGSGRRGERILVHRIILETFVGPAPTPETQGRHGDRNPQNNAVSNLQWGDQPSNWQDSKRHGMHRRYSKLTQDEASAIRSRHAGGETGEALAREYGVSATQIRNIATGRQWNIEPPIAWPLANCWLGVSAEDQIRADERIPDLLATPAAVRFVSAEPLLGMIDFTHLAYPGRAGADAMSGYPLGPLDWIIVGGESGKGARPNWVPNVRSIVKQCKRAGVPVFVKQMGANVQDRNDAGFDGCELTSWPDMDPFNVEHDINGYREEYQGASVRIRLRDRKGADMAEWPEDLRVQEFPKP